MLFHIRIWAWEVLWRWSKKMLMQEHTYCTAELIIKSVQQLQAYEAA